MSAQIIDTPVAAARSTEPPHPLRELYADFSRNRGAVAGLVIIVLLLTIAATAILDAAALGFRGLGAQPPAPEWGTMLADAREFILRAWWVVTLPGLMILVTVLAFNLFGDGLRDALDPKLKR